MIKTIILIFILLQVVGDFYLKQKEVTKYKNVLSNAFIYQLLFLLPFFMFEFKWDILMISLIGGFTSLILNTILYFNSKTNTKKFNKQNMIKQNIFLILQAVNLTIIIASIYCLVDLTENSTVLTYLKNHMIYMKWVLAILLIGKPSNVIFKHVILQFKPTEKSKKDKDLFIIEQNKTFKNAGAAIGTLERILILICLVNDLYSSIGLIFTAKSIARYNRISEDPEFSEYYLLGTLSSVLFTIIIYYICFFLF